MRHLFRCTSSLLLAIAPAQGFAAPAQEAPVAADNAPVRQDALELAQLLNPTEPLMTLAARTMDESFDKGLTAEGAAALEKKYPGFVAALRSAVRDVTIAKLSADMPIMHRRYAQLFAENLKPEEVAELIEFYRSPTGARIIQAKFSNFDVSGLTERIAKDDSAISADDFSAVHETTTQGMWKGMSADDMRAVMTFGLRPAAKKLNQMAPKLAEIEAEMANEPDPELEAAVDTASRKVYKRFGVERPDE